MRSTEGKCEGQKSYLEVDPELVQAIRSMRQLPKTGFKRMPFREIAEALNTQAKTTKHGQPFKAANVGMIWKRCR